MGDDDGRREGPSLELPSWRSWRGRKQRDAERGPQTPSTAAGDAAGPDTRVETPAPEPPAPRRRPRRPRPGRRPGGMPAALLTGLVVGLVAVGLVWAFQRGCEAVRGTSSCGGGPGFLLLLAIMVAMVFLGAALLRTLSVPDPGSTSFLGVGLLAVVTLLFFVEVLLEWWTAIAIPVCAALSYALSHWVTATVAEPDR